MILPKPDIEPTVSLWSDRFHVPDEPTITAETSAITSSAPLVNIPPFIVVGPLYVFATDSVNVPGPTFVRPPEPDMIPL